MSFFKPIAGQSVICTELTFNNKEAYLEVEGYLYSLFIDSLHELIERINPDYKNSAPVFLKDDASECQKKIKALTDALGDFKDKKLTLTKLLTIAKRVFKKTEEVIFDSRDITELCEIEKTRATNSYQTNCLRTFIRWLPLSKKWGFGESCRSWTFTAYIAEREQLMANLFGRYEGTRANLSDFLKRATFPKDTYTTSLEKQIEDAVNAKNEAERQKADAIAAKNTAISQVNNMIGTHNIALTSANTEKEQAIREKDAAIATIAEKDRIIEERDKEIQSLKEKIQSLESELQELKASQEKSIKEIQILSAEVKDLKDDQIESKKQQHESIKSIQALFDSKMEELAEQMRAVSNQEIAVLKSQLQLLQNQIEDTKNKLSQEKDNVFKSLLDTLEQFKAYLNKNLHEELQLISKVCENKAITTKTPEDRELFKKVSAFQVKLADFQKNFDQICIDIDEREDVYSSSKEFIQALKILKLDESIENQTRKEIVSEIVAYWERIDFTEIDLLQVCTDLLAKYEVVVENLKPIYDLSKRLNSLKKCIYTLKRKG